MQAVKDREFPHDLLPSLRDIRFVCPLCQGSLDITATGYGCGMCKKDFPLHAGIPDFRVFADPYLDFQEDHDRTEIVLAGLEKYELEKLLEYYWSFSDITPVDLRSKFVRSAMLGEKRAKRILETFGDGTFHTNISAKKVLEIGSGTGNFLALAMEQFEQVVGIDIAMRWLHVSRRRFMDKGLPAPPLVCCCAEYLPFADDSFDLVAATSTLEFVQDQVKVLSEAARVLTDDGAFYLSTANRYSLARDPYSYLWGVGFLPRKWHAKYVYWRSRAVYKTRTLSYKELDSRAAANFSSRQFTLPDIDSITLKQFSAFTRFQVHVYRAVKKLPGISHLFKLIGPGWDVVLSNSARKERES